MDFPFLLERLKQGYEVSKNVSILVLMDFPFLLKMRVSYELDLNRFQSLFLWIFRSYLT